MESFEVSVDSLNAKVQETILDICKRLGWFVEWDDPYYVITLPCEDDYMFDLLCESGLLDRRGR